MKQIADQAVGVVIAHNAAAEREAKKPKLSLGLAPYLVSPYAVPSVLTSADAQR